MSALARLAVLAVVLAAASPALARPQPAPAAHDVGTTALDTAIAHVARRDWAAARHVLEQRLAQVPDDDAARFLLARVRAWQGEPEAALPLYAALLAREPDNADYLLGQGLAQLWAGRRAAAIDTLERAQRRAPGDADVDRALAQARAAEPGAASAAADRPPEADRPAAPVEPSNRMPPRAATPTPSDAMAPPPAGNDTLARDTPRAAAADARVEPSAAGRRRSLVLTARHDRLDRGFDDWQAWRLDGAAIGGGRVGVTGVVFSETRFGLDDHGVELGLVVPLRRGWTLQPQLGAVPDAQFLPRRVADLRLERAFGAGWIGAASLRRSDYRDVRVERLALGLERYVGAWRAGYTATATRLRGTHAVGHDLRVARGYGDGGEVGVQFATGREDALLGTRVVASDVRAWSLGGRHPLTAGWALRWNAGHVAQGALYTRTGLALGLERRF